jgi:hypothetical protein
MEDFIPILIVLLIVFSPMIIGIMFMGAQKAVRVIHTQSGITKEGYVGFCWTYFLFGFLVPLFRGEIGIALMHFIFTVISFGLFQIIMPFLYNKQYMTRMLTAGWELYDTPQINDWARMKLSIANR